MADQIPSYLKPQIDKIRQKIAETQDLIQENPELQSLAQQELAKLNQQKDTLEKSAQQTQSPDNGGERGHNSNPKDAIIEIRAAAGGDEAGLFAQDLYRMYLRYADSQGWKTNQISISEGGLKNIKEVVFEVVGRQNNPAYSALKFESGVHRVQRVPITESSGRIHTSTVTVAVLPKIPPQEIEIRNSDLQVETFRSRGPGGQSVNTTDSAVRITHIPTNITVSVQNEKSQHQNRQKAMEILTSRLYQMMQDQQKENIDDLRSEQIGTGERSEKIRTYNFPQNRVTDHRINQSWHNLQSILDGELDKIIEKL